MSKQGASNTNTTTTTNNTRQSSRPTQNDSLTLPPINEAQPTANGSSKKNQRIDSGIDAGLVWTLSPQGSDNNDASATDNNNYHRITTTVVEIVDSPSQLKKNATSSTLNSYGKSSSIQSRVTANNSHHSSNPKFNLSATSTAPSSSVKVGVGAKNAAINEQEYIESIARLHNVNDDEYVEMNQSRFKFEASSKHNGKQQLKTTNASNNGGSNLDVSANNNNNDDYVYYSNISNGNVSNHSQNYYQNSSLPGGGKPLERSLTNYHLHQQKKANLNHFSVKKPGNHLTTPRNQTNGNGTKQQQQHPNLNMSRQNTNLSDIKDFSPLMTRRNSNLTTNSINNSAQQQQQIQSRGGQPAQLHPPVKPRKVDKRNASLQRQNSFITQDQKNQQSQNQIQR